MAKLSEVEEMLEKAEADEEKEKIITGHKNKKEDEAKSGWKVVLEYVRVIAIGALIAFFTLQVCYHQRCYSNKINGQHG